jgi:hypothetical protein
MQSKHSKLMYSMNVKMETAGKWGCKKAGAIISIPNRQSLIYSSTGPFLASFSYSLIQ